MDYFNLSGPQPAVIPKSRDVAYIRQEPPFTPNSNNGASCNTRSTKRTAGKPYPRTTPPPSTDCGSDSNRTAASSMVDTALGCDRVFPRKQRRITPPHRAWVSVYPFGALAPRQLSEIVMDFIKPSQLLIHVTFSRGRTNSGRMGSYEIIFIDMERTPTCHPTSNNLYLTR